jgi:hypothetical protein
MLGATHQESGSVLNAEVLDFCAREDIGKELDAAIELARTHFCITAGPVVQLEQDPELDNYYLVLEITIRGDTAEIVAAHKEFARQWSSMVPWPKSERVRLVYDID